MSNGSMSNGFRRSLHAASGVAYMLTATVCFTLMTALVKWVSPRVPTAEIVLWRSALPLPLLYWLLRRRQLSVWPSRPYLLLRRGLAGLAAMSLSFYGYGRLPLGDATLLTKLEPVLIALLALWMLGERAGRATWLSVALSLVGVTLVLQPTLQVEPWGAGALMASILASSLAQVSVRQLSATESTPVIVFGFAAVASAFVLPVAIPVLVQTSLADTVALVAMALAGTAGQLLMTKAYAVEEAAVVSATSYASVAFAALWGYLIWRETPNALALMGGSLIIGSGIFLMFSRRGAGPRRMVASQSRD